MQMYKGCIGDCFGTDHDDGLMKQGKQGVQHRLSKTAQFLGLDLAQVRLACPGAMLAHPENSASSGTTAVIKKGKVTAI